MGMGIEIKIRNGINTTYIAIRIFKKFSSDFLFQNFLLFTLDFNSELYE
jgi:hypothetical protein